MNAKNRIIIVGGNAAGPAAAAKAKRQNPSAEIIMFEAGEFISTGTCELPYLLKGDIKNYQDIVFFTPEKFLKEKGVHVFINHIVESIDKRNKKIRVKDLSNNSEREVSYTKLILATGSKAKTIPILSGNLNNLFNLKSVSDYLKIKKYIEGKSLNNVLIIGAGYIGLETAEAFANLGAKITIIEKAELPMPLVDIELQRLVLETLTDNNVEFIGATNAEFITEGNKIKHVKVEGRIKEYDLYLSAIGFEPNNSLALSAQLEIGNFGGLKVNNKMLTSDPHIFAAGDNVEIANAVTGKKDYIPLATYAHQQGHIAGANAAGGNERTRPIVHNAAVKIFDKSVCTVGLSSKQAADHLYKFESVSKVVRNLVGVMPESEKVFGKIIYEKDSKLILGASFIGKSEVIGFGNMISLMIKNKIKANELASIDYNYTPPLSPIINLLSVLGRKIK